MDLLFFFWQWGGDFKNACYSYLRVCIYNFLVKFGRHSFRKYFLRVFHLSFLEVNSIHPYAVGKISKNKNTFLKCFKWKYRTSNWKALSKYSDFFFILVDSPCFVLLRVLFIRIFPVALLLTPFKSVATLQRSHGKPDLQPQ